MIGLIMFGVALLLLLVGFPVAFTFGGVAVFFGLLAEGPEIFALMPHRIWSIMNNTILMAIPLFIFMGIVLQKSNLAERLLESCDFVSFDNELAILSPCLRATIFCFIRAMMRTMSGDRFVRGSKYLLAVVICSLGTPASCCWSLPPRFESRKLFKKLKLSFTSALSIFCCFLEGL